MRRLGAVLFGVLLGGGLVWFGFHYHVVRTGEGLLYVPKTSATLVDTYVDIRDWSAEEWQDHPDLIAAVVKDGREELIVQPTSGDIIRRLFDKFRGAARDETDSRTMNR